MPIRCVGTSGLIKIRPLDVAVISSSELEVFTIDIIEFILQEVLEIVFASAPIIDDLMSVEKVRF